METQNKTVQFKVKMNYAAADNYGDSFAALSTVVMTLVSTFVLALFIPGLIAFVVSVVLGVVLMRAMSSYFVNVRREAREINKRSMNEAIEPYDLVTYYYDGGITNIDRETFMNKERTERYGSVAGRVNGDVATIVLDLETVLKM